MAPRNDFVWSDEPEPHVARRQAILAKYGKEVRALFGPEPRTKFFGLIPIALQLFLAWSVIDLPTWQFLVIAYIIGGTLNHCLFLLIHEVTHHLAFDHWFYNDLFAIFSNLPIAAPYSMMFKMYHQEHHRYQGWDGIDSDIPLWVEAKLLSNLPGKIFFCGFQLAFYALRPLFVKSQKITGMVILNAAVILSFDAFVYFFVAPKALLYLLLSTFFAGCFHPMSGHFIAEHYTHIFHPGTDQETFSYYGPMNFFGWNVGLHNEHHDFPNIPWSRLPQLRRIAPEFYEPLVKCDSWPGTIWRFITNPNISLYSRVKRERDAGKRKGALLRSQQQANEAGSPTTPKSHSE